jgi:glycyl-tRNA synthetase (class II)
LPGAIALIEKTDPATGAKIRAHIAQVQNLYSASQQARAQQEQLQQQRVDAWAKAEDAKFEKEVFSKESPETRQKLQRALPEIIERDFGIPRDDFAFALKNTPILLLGLSKSASQCGEVGISPKGSR